MEHPHHHQLQRSILTNIRFDHCVTARSGHGTLAATDIVPRAQTRDLSSRVVGQSLISCTAHTVGGAAIIILVVEDDLGKGVGAWGGEIILDCTELLKLKRGRSWHHYFEVGCIITGFDDVGTER